MGEWYLIAGALCAITSVVVTACLAVRLVKQQRRLVRLAERLGLPASNRSSVELFELLDAVSTLSPSSHSVDELIRLCHELLGATGLELLISPELDRDVSATTAIRMTSGRGISRNALERTLTLGHRKIGILRLAAPQLSPGGEILIARIADALAFQLLVQRSSRELRTIHEMQVAGAREQTGFVASLSHELRGPLGMILNAVELVRDELCGPVTPDQRETLSLVHGNVRHLLSLVNDVLDYAKTESGVAAPNPTDNPVKPLVEEVVAAARGQAELKSQSLTITNATQDGVGVRADERHTRQILLNLLTNAIKYTPRGGKITVEVKESEPHALEISVSDTGVGIPADELEKVFTPFGRVSTGLSEQGTGLGMPLSKLLAEKNGGSLGFSSTVGVGSCFRLILPRSERQAVCVAEPAQASRIDLAGQALLVASKDRDQLAVLERALKAQQASVTPVEISGDAGAAPDGLASRDCTAVIIDANVLPSLDGHPVGDLSGWVRFAGTLRVPLVVLTGHAFPSDIESYLKAGADLCIPKPFKATELAQALKRLSRQPGIIG